MRRKLSTHPKADERQRREFQHATQRCRRPIVYIDESGFANDMPRTHGYASIGQRCHGLVDWHSKGRINVIGAISDFKLITTCLFDTHINSDIFHAWLTQDLLPKLKRSCVIVIDNASFRKRADMIRAIKRAGHRLLFLPPYSPDLNPIEKKWAQAKAFRKKLQCSIDQVFCLYNL